MDSASLSESALCALGTSTHVHMPILTNATHTHTHTHRYYCREDAEKCVRYISGTKLDDRIVRADWDAGFKEGRQYGRGRTGGQVGVAY